MKTLTEAQAWREVARRDCEGEGPYWGLCTAVYQLEDDGLVVDAVCRAMFARLNTYLSGDLWAYKTRGSVWNRRSHLPFRPARALAALWLACEAEAGE